ARALEREGGNFYRARAYRRAAEVVLRHPRPLRAALDESGRAGLERVPGVGGSLAYTIEGLIRTGELRTLRPEDAAREPDRLALSLPGVGKRLAERLRDRLGVTTVAELDAAAKAGRLAELGISPKQLQSLLGVLNDRAEQACLSAPLPGEPG